MKSNKLSLAVLLALTTALSGCMSNLGGDTYSREDARAVQTVMYGTISSLRPVQIEGTKTPIGAIAGAGIGGVAGSTIGGGKGAIITTIIGAVGGGLLGAAGENLLTKSNGVEITFRLDSGAIRSVVQQVQTNERFSVGQRIKVMSVNGQTRVTAA
jgi:outer membrane lipoprotein SlyB